MVNEKDLPARHVFCAVLLSVQNMLNATAQNNAELTNTRQNSLNIPELSVHRFVETDDVIRAE